MATIRTTYKYKCDLDKGTLETTLRNSLMQADALADAFAVTVQRNGEDVDISGMTVYGYLYASATKTTVPLKGTISGSTATVILSEDCYAVPGYASLMIQIHDGDVRQTVLKVDFVVTRTGGTLVLDGDSILPTLAELLGHISAMEQATAEAREATAVANQAVENVEAFKGEIQGDITALTEDIGKVSANTRNLWPFGESVEVSTYWASTIVSPLGEFALPAGTYTVSAIVSSTGINSSKSCIAFCKDEAGNPLASVNLDRNAREYGTFTLPEDANLIVIYAETTSSNSAGDTAVWKNIQIESGTLMTDYIPPVSAKDIVLHEEVKKSSAVNKAIKSSVSEMNGTSGYAVIGMIPNVKKNERLVLRGKVSSIGTLTFGTYYGSISDGKKVYFEITDTEIIAYQYSGDSVAYSHGLTITNNITLLVEGNSTTEADVTLISNGEIFKQSDVRWDRRYPCGLFARGGIGSKLTDIDIEWTCTDLTKDIWMFGDSYFSYTDRWYKYMFQYGYADNLLMAAFPGATSTHMMMSLKTLLAIARPKAIVWCLGMNDGSDAGEPSPDWMSNVKELETLCANLDIELILATTPTVPTISHEYKNAYVRESGLRYIDFAEAVGASADGVWYADMLSSDGVHPTDKGAMALFGAVIADLPEAMVTN